MPKNINVLRVEQVMPCGYDRTGIPLIKRLKHYRLCVHPACKERLQAWENLKLATAGGIQIKELK